MKSERRVEAWFSDKALSWVSRDPVAGATGSYLWRALAWVDVRSKCRRAHPASFWITLSVGSLVLAVGTFYSQFFGQEVDAYLPYSTTGMLVWCFISSAVSGGTAVLANAASYIRPVSRARGGRPESSFCAVCPRGNDRSRPWPLHAAPTRHGRPSPRMDFTASEWSSYGFSRAAFILHARQG